MNPIDGLDEPLRPLNMVQEGSAEDLEADAEAAEPPAQEKTEAKDDAEDTAAVRLSAVVASAAERWARRISRAGTFDDKDIALIAEALAVSPDRAAAWAHAISANPIGEAELTQSLIALGETP